ncbi:MAG: L-rhamnose isomerase [Lentisphaeria bacterium]
MNLEKNFNLACESFAEYGVDVKKRMHQLDQIKIGIHAWQGDDVVGFENTAHALTGGCQVTGNYPGCARNADELRADLDLALKLIPGTHRVVLQGHQVDKMIPGRDRDAFTIENFQGWLDWASAKKIGIDIAPAFYSHPKLDHGFSLSHPDSNIRKFWIEHGKRIREIAAEFGQKLGTPSVCNFWMPDGFKDIPADRYSFRQRMVESLDEIFTEKFSPELIRDAIESKLFGIGTESCTITSNEFCLLYAQTRNKMVCFDSGHFHPTESIGDKLSAVLSFMPEVLLHVSRGVHWDSDHVLVMNDQLQEIAREIVQYDYKDNVHIQLDYFDASINRIAAWVIGARNMQKALLQSLLEPRPQLINYEKQWDFTRRLALQEEAKMLPFGAVWNYYCQTHGVPCGEKYMDEIRAYEKETQRDD